MSSPRYAPPYSTFTVEGAMVNINSQGSHQQDNLVAFIQGNQLVINDRSIEICRGVLADYTGLTGGTLALIMKDFNDNYTASAGGSVSLTGSASDDLSEIASNTGPASLTAGAFGEQTVAQLDPQIQVEFPYNINTDIVTDKSSAGGSISQADAKCTASTSAAAGGIGWMQTNRVMNYDPGEGATVRFTAIFSTGVAGNIQVAGYGDPNSADADGYFFGYNGATFSIIRYQDGTSFPVAQSAWNQDPADGTGVLPAMDWTKGNVFQIRFQWLGYGAIRFYVENPDTGAFLEVHRILYAGTSTEPSIYNPSLPLCIFTRNTTNATNITISTSSMAAFSEGFDKQLGPTNTHRNTHATVGTTLENVFTIRNKSTYASVTNRVRITPIFSSASADGTKPVAIRVFKDATLSGGFSGTDINTVNSVVEYDNTTTHTVTGGKELWDVDLSKTGSSERFVEPLDFDLAPGETLTFAAQVVSSGSSEVSISLAWRENF